MKCMTKMENAVMNLTRCDRMTANLVANAVLDIERVTENEDTNPCPSPNIDISCTSPYVEALFDVQTRLNRSNN